METTWTKSQQIAPDARVVIDGTRRRGWSYTAKEPLTSAEIRLIDLHGERTPILLGPNVTICHYVDSNGTTVRGSSPPDEEYLAVWLKSCGAPELAAAPIAKSAAQLFDVDALDHGTLGPDWNVTQVEWTSEFTNIAAIIALFVVWIVGVWYTLIPKGRK